MGTPPLPHPPAPGEPRRPNVTRRVWPDETQPLTDAGQGIPDADDTPTRLLPHGSCAGSKTPTPTRPP